MVQNKNCNERVQLGRSVHLSTRNAVHLLLVDSRSGSGFASDVTQFIPEFVKGTHFSLFQIGVAGSLQDQHTKRTQ